MHLRGYLSVRFYQPARNPPCAPCRVILSSSIPGASAAPFGPHTMSVLANLTGWLDIRPGEGRTFLLSTAGAFLVMSFLVVARSLREAFFLDEFSIEALPYMIMATALVNVPSVALFTRLLARRPPQTVYRWVLVGLAAGLGVLFVVTTWPPTPAVIQPATVLFFLLTAVGSLLLTSGFWVLASEIFPLRDAKRLFGMISAGGTLGAMIAGLSVAPLADRIGNAGLVLTVIGSLVALSVVLALLPLEGVSREMAQGPGGPGQDVGLLLGNPHLRNIAAVVAVATMASFLLDYQFKEFAVAQYDTDESMAGFFGRFYGITGVVALLIQVLLASRMLAYAGVAWSLALLPLALIGGGTLLLLVPGMLTATLARGADASLRKSLHRSVIEYLFVPVPSLLRRRTKTLIDSLVDNAAEGLGALLVSVWVAVNLPSRALSFPLIGLAAVFLWLSWRMGSLYMQTLLDRLKEGRASLDEELPPEMVTGELTVTMTRFDLETVLNQSGLTARDELASPQQDVPPDRSGRAPVDGEREEDAAPSRLERLRSSDPEVVSAALDEHDGWSSEHVPDLVRLLARDALARRATGILGGLGPRALDDLVEVLLDEDSDFVIRRRVPRVLAHIDDPRADDALLDALFTRRFEVRYRAAVALARRRKRGLAEAEDADERVWDAVRKEVGRDRPIWELQKLLDDRPSKDDFVVDRVYGRGELSLEHTFRLMSLVLEPDPIRTAFFGVILDDDRLQSISLEYLEQVLPGDIRKRLWPFIGDISEHQRQRDLRDVEDVVADLLRTGATLFTGPGERQRLRDALDEAEEEPASPGDGEPPGHEDR